MADWSGDGDWDPGGDWEGVTAGSAGIRVLLMGAGFVVFTVLLVAVRSVGSGRG